MTDAIQLFSIEYTNQTAVYLPDMNVVGKLILILDKPLTIRGLRLQFIGHAKAEFAYGKGPFRPNQLYFFHEITLWGNPLDLKSPNPTMAIGKYEFPFDFKIPNQQPLPGSWTSRAVDGSISYAVKAVIDRPILRSDIIIEKEFLIPPAALRLNRQAMEPVVVSDERTVCCWCCVSGKISCTIKLPKTGYVGGEIVPIWADINNQSYKTVKAVYVYLVQTVTYREEEGLWIDPSKPIESRPIDYILVVLKNEKPIRRGCKQEWRNEAMIIPPISDAPPTLLNWNLCKLIQINYQIVFEIIPEGCSYGFEVKAPIIIGTPTE